MNDLPPSRAIAKVAGLTRYFNGKPCVNDHIAARHTSNGQCIVCLKASTRRYRSENPDKVAATLRTWRLNNREHVREFHRDYMRDKPEKKREYDLTYRMKKKASAAPKVKAPPPTPEVLLARAERKRLYIAKWLLENKVQQAQYIKEHKRKHPGRYAQYNAARKLRKR